MLKDWKKKWTELKESKGERSVGKEKQPLTLKNIGIGKLVIMLVCGIFIIVLSFMDFNSTSNKPSTNSTKNATTTNHKATEQASDEYTDIMEKKLKDVLSKVDGIGKVEAMITVKSTKESVPLQDEPYTKETTKEQDSAGGSRDSESVNQQQETVMNNTNGNTSPYIVKELEPEIEGVVVIAQGGESKEIQSEIVEAVMVLFDVPAHKIKVMKMNS